jgi:exodeoxyribonuclease VII small subunit
VSTARTKTTAGIKTGTEAAAPAEPQPQDAPGQAPDQIAFGEAMERLEAVVAQLEGDESLELEQALALYEQGVSLAAACRGRLARAELRLTEIAGRPPDDA